jgi:hypothetical protein
MSAIERKYASRSNASPQPKDAANNILRIDSQLDSKALVSLARKLTPPSSGKSLPIRPIHPDLVVLVFSLITPLFLYRIFTTQPNMLPWILLLLACFFGFFFFKRKSLVEKFEAQRLAQKSAEERIQRGMKRWMELYYCARDDIVFNPLEAESIPVDLINGYLLQG